MDYERQWLIDILRHLGRGQAAKDAARECPNASRARSSGTLPDGTASSPLTSLPTSWAEAPENGEVPLVPLQNFRGDLDSWDPALVDPRF